MSDWVPRTLSDFLGDAVVARGAEEALVTPTARLTHAEVSEAAHRVARALLAIGVRRGDFVGLLMGNDERWVASFYGAALIGAVTVPLNTRWKPPEMAFALRQAGCVALLAAGRFLKLDFAAMLREAEPALDRALPGKALPTLRHVVLTGEDVPSGAMTWDEFLRDGEGVDVAPARAAVRDDDTLLIQFTSGTTSFPKGVILTHHNMLRDAHAVSLRMGVHPDDRYFNCRPFFHVAGTTLSLLVALVTPCCLVTLPTFEAGEALAMMEAERCTLTSGNDSLFQMMLAHPDLPQRRLHLRGGWAAAGPATMRRIMAETGARHVCVAYGLSEASPNVVLSDWRDPAELRIEGLAKPHPGVEVRIAEDGEIQVRGWNVMRGYLNNPEATAGAFTADGWLRTGDLGTLTDDGRLRMVGRLKDVIRVGGENMAPAEVEEVLLGHPDVEMAQVVGIPDGRLGEVPVAFCTVRAGAAADEAALLDWLRPKVANFRMPRHLRIVPDFEPIGMTASGKVQKAKLREHARGLFAAP
ncbi:AMP-binding protein [Roseomonas sp. CCTCC AB2023176]|uniref:AMP-binding protein n=1 Tax=Roseomonas sp. CCTCC AB2023176 TaxID=3342640 RepID=UPI0035E0BCD2